MNSFLELIKSLNYRSKWVVAVIFITLFSSYPYVFNRFYSLPNLNIMIVVELSVLFLVCNSIKKKISLPKPLIVVCSIQIVIYFLLFVYHCDAFYISRFALFVIIAVYSLYAILNSIGLNKFIQINNWWIVIQAVLGGIAFFLILFNILVPLSVYFNEETYNTINFYGITTSNAIFGNIIRIAGFFDEPGALAQWGIYALVLNKISLLYNRKIEILLIIGLIFTFSMAYFIQLTIYLILFNISSIKKSFFIVCVLLLSIFIAQTFISEKSELYQLTLKRFEVNSGKLETNRDDLSEQAKKFFVAAPLCGKGYTYLVNNADNFYDNPYETLATSGIIGTFALYLPLFVILLHYRKGGAWQAVVVISLGYMQRPFHVQYIHYMMLYLLFIQCYYLNRHESYNKII